MAGVHGALMAPCGLLKVWPAAAPTWRQQQQQLVRRLLHPGRRPATPLRQAPPTAQSAPWALPLLLLLLLLVAPLAAWSLPLLLMLLLLLMLRGSGQCLRHEGLLS